LYKNIQLKKAFNNRVNRQRILVYERHGE